MNLEKPMYEQGSPREVREEKTEDFSFKNVWKKFLEFFRGKKMKSSEISREFATSREGREIALADSALENLEEKAKEDVASFMGEGNEIVEQIPPSEFKKVAWYNIASTPEGFFNETARKKFEASINIDRVEQAQRGWQEYLTEKIKNHDVVVLGEAHTAEMIEKEAFTDFLSEAKTVGISDVGVEIGEQYQEAFDRFLDTGKFADADDPADYEKVGEYQRLRLE